MLLNLKLLRFLFKSWMIDGAFCRHVKGSLEKEKNAFHLSFVLNKSIFCLFSLTRLNNLKPMSLNAAIGRYSKRCFGAAETILKPRTVRTILTLFDTIVWKFGSQDNFEIMVHSGALWDDVFEVLAADNSFKARTVNGTFWRFFKRCFFEV